MLRHNNAPTLNRECALFLFILGHLTALKEHFGFKSVNHFWSK